MDALKNFAGGLGGGQNQNQNESSSDSNQGGGGFLSNIGNKINSAAGGGPESEKNEDYLDKGSSTLDQL